MTSRWRARHHRSCAASWSRCSDTFSSRGGLSDLRFAGAYRVRTTPGCSVALPHHHRLQPAAIPSRVRRYDLPGRHPELGAVVRRRRVRRRSDPELRPGIQRRGHGSVRRARECRSRFEPHQHRGPAVYLRAAASAGTRSSSSSSGAKCWCGPGPARTATCSRSAASARTTRWRSRWAPSSRRTSAGRTAGRSAWARATGRCRSCWCPASNRSEFGISVGSGMRFAQDRAGMDLGPGARLALGGGVLGAGVPAEHWSDGAAVGEVCFGARSGPPMTSSWPCPTRALVNGPFFSPRIMKRVYIETYGCQMNVADSELMFGLLGRDGLRPRRRSGRRRRHAGQHLRRPRQRRAAGDRPDGRAAAPQAARRRAGRGGLHGAAARPRAARAGARGWTSSSAPTPTGTSPS